MTCSLAIVAVRFRRDEHEIVKAEITHHPGRGAQIADNVRPDQHHPAETEMR